MSTDENVVENLKQHAETPALVAVHEPEALADHLKSLYNRVWGDVKADWVWIANHFKREANDTAAAKPDENAATAGKTASAPRQPAGNALNDAPAASQK